MRRLFRDACLGQQLASSVQLQVGFLHQGSETLKVSGQVFGMRRRAALILREQVSAHRIKALLDSGIGKRHLEGLVQLLYGFFWRAFWRIEPVPDRHINIRYAQFSRGRDIREIGVPLR